MTLLSGSGPAYVRWRDASGMVVVGVEFRNGSVPQLVAAAEQQLQHTTELLALTAAAAPGERFKHDGQAYRRVATGKRADPDVGRSWRCWWCGQFLMGDRGGGCGGAGQRWSVGSTASIASSAAVSSVDMCAAASRTSASAPLAVATTVSGVWELPFAGFRRCSRSCSRR